MARIPLSITTKYLPSWGVYEGIRELIQNAKDAEVECNAPMEVEYVNGVLRIENDGTTLPHQALLMGHTTKDGRSDTIGKFGEGLKLGMLALVRAGYLVKIRSGSEVWVPTVARSDLFDADVLTVDIAAGREPKNRVRVEVTGLDKDDWTDMKSSFLFLNKPVKGDRISTYEGTLLLSPAHKGKIFVKGIFVQSVPGLNYGYDLKDAEIDRDRRMIESWNLESKTRSIFLAAMSSSEASKGLHDAFLDILSSSGKDIGGIEYAAYNVPVPLVDLAVNAFVRDHGPDAVPVANLAEAQELAHLGAVGVIVPNGQRAVLAKKLGNLNEIKAKLAFEVVKEYTRGYLTVTEINNLTSAEALVSKHVGKPPKVHIVDFRSSNMMGQYRDGEVYIARKVLASRKDTLRVLVHEVSHKHGTDGEKGHVAAIEELWASIVEGLR